MKKKHAVQTATALVASPEKTRARTFIRRLVGASLWLTGFGAVSLTMPQASGARASQTASSQGVSSAVVQRRADSVIDAAARAYLDEKYARSLLMCVQATQIAPNYPRAWIGLGKTQAALGQKDEAERAYRRALQLGARGIDATRAKNGLRQLGLSIRPPRYAKVATVIPVRTIAPFKNWKAARTFVVSPDGDLKSIAQTIKNAPPYSRIEVAPGTYRESLLVDKPLQIVGSKLGDVIVENADAPCLSLRTNGATVARLVFKATVSEKGSNRFHAVEIPLGRSLLTDCEVQTEARVGISAYGSSTRSLIVRCKVTGARTSGIMVYSRARADIDNCDVSGSAYAGLEVFEAGNVFMRGSTIYENRTGVIAETTASVLLQDCTIEKNTWQGVRVEPYGNLFLRRTMVRNNVHDVSRGKAARFLTTK